MSLFWVVVLGLGVMSYIGTYMVFLFEVLRAGPRRRGFWGTAREVLLFPFWPLVGVAVVVDEVLEFVWKWTPIRFAVRYGTWTGEDRLFPDRRISFHSNGIRYWGMRSGYRTTYQVSIVLNRKTKTGLAFCVGVGGRKPTPVRESTGSRLREVKL